MYHRRDRDRVGFTFVELMVAALVGTLLVAGLVAYLLSAKRQLKYEELSRRNRMVMESIKHLLRQEGEQIIPIGNIVDLQGNPQPTPSGLYSLMPACVGASEPCYGSLTQPPNGLYYIAWDSSHAVLEADPTVIEAQCGGVSFAFNVLGGEYSRPAGSFAVLSNGSFSQLVEFAQDVSCTGAACNAPQTVVFRNSPSNYWCQTLASNRPQLRVIQERALWIETSTNTVYRASNEASSTGSFSGGFAGQSVPLDISFRHRPILLNPNTASADTSILAREVSKLRFNFLPFVSGSQPPTYMHCTPQNGAWDGACGFFYDSTSPSGDFPAGTEANWALATMVRIVFVMSIDDVWTQRFGVNPVNRRFHAFAMDLKPAAFGHRFMGGDPLLFLLEDEAPEAFCNDSARCMTVECMEYYMDTHSGYDSESARDAFRTACYCARGQEAGCCITPAGANNYCSPECHEVLLAQGDDPTTRICENNVCCSSVPLLNSGTGQCPGLCTTSEGQACFNGNEAEECNTCGGAACCEGANACSPACQDLCEQPGNNCNACELCRAHAQNTSPNPNANAFLCANCEAPAGGVDEAACCDSANPEDRCDKNKCSNYCERCYKPAMSPLYEFVPYNTRAPYVCNDECGYCDADFPQKCIPNSTTTATVEFHQEVCTTCSDILPQPLKEAYCCWGDPNDSSTCTIDNCGLINYCSYCTEGKCSDECFDHELFGIRMLACTQCQDCEKTWDKCVEHGTPNIGMPPPISTAMVSYFNINRCGACNDWYRMHPPTTHPNLFHGFCQDCSLTTAERCELCDASECCQNIQFDGMIPAIRSLVPGLACNVDGVDEAECTHSGGCTCPGGNPSWCDANNTPITCSNVDSILDMLLAGGVPISDDLRTMQRCAACAERCEPACILAEANLYHGGSSDWVAGQTCQCFADAGGTGGACCDVDIEAVPEFSPVACTTCPDGPTGGWPEGACGENCSNNAFACNNWETCKDSPNRTLTDVETCTFCAVQYPDSGGAAECCHSHLAGLLGSNNHNTGLTLACGTCVANYSQTEVDWFGTPTPLTEVCACETSVNGPPDPATLCLPSCRHDGDGRDCLCANHFCDQTGCANGTAEWLQACMFCCNGGAGNWGTVCLNDPLLLQPECLSNEENCTGDGTDGSRQTRWCTATSGAANN